MGLMMARFSANEFIGLTATFKLRKIGLLLAFLVLAISSASAPLNACTATVQNWNNSNDQSGATSVSLTATVNAVGDLVAITAWCGPEANCTPTSVTLGSQSATEAPVHSTGLDANEGEGFIYYILSAAASGPQTLTFNETGNTSEIQVAYYDFSVSAGCKFAYDTSSSLGTGTGTTINTPSITPSAAGELLFNFTWVSEHVTSVGTPWLCNDYTGSGQSGTCFYTSTVDADAYVLSSSSGSTANNMTNIHTTDTWAAGIVAFAMSSSGGGSGGSGGTAVANPTFSPIAGTYSSAQSVTISDSTGGATICWNVGSVPTTNGAGTCTSGTTYSGPITASSTETIYAIGTMSGDTDSSTVSAAYTISASSVANPTFSPVAGIYTSAQTVTISDATSGVTICWNIGSAPTTNGSGTCTSGTTYSGAITVSSTETIYAIATESGHADSSTVSAAYTINTSSSCPSGANYRGSSAGSLVTLSSLGVTRCFYVSAAGSDSNSGTSESSPWLHAPGMPNCSNTCAGVTPAAEEGFIFRGGDTWHFGNSSLTPYTAGTWQFSWSGSSGSPIYFGVDQTWYNSSVCGSLWCRPILDGDNAISTSTTLGNCTYRVTANSSENDMIGMNNSTYVTIDNFEMMGMCANGDSSEQSFGWDAYLEGGASTNSLFEDLYIHGWTHHQFDYPTYQYSGFVFLGSGMGDNYQYNVVDGSDSDPAGWGQFYDAPYDASYNVFDNGSQGIGNDCHTFHDNLMENWVLPGDGNAHGNVFECVGETSGTNIYYNNVFAHVYASGGTGAIFWIGPLSGATDYFFNNVIYDTVATGNYFNIQNASGGNIYAFNSTLQSSGSAGLMDCEGGAKTHGYNMHFITQATTPYYGSGTCSTTTNLLQNNSTANGQGYTGSETYAYSPTSGSGSTVGGGTNEQSLCTTISGINAAAGAACQSDTGYACTYNTSNHTVSCPARTPVARPSSVAWDQGAYQYSGTQASAPNPPTGLTASVQ